MNIFKVIEFVETFGLTLVETVFNVTELQTFLSEDNHFDVVIIERFLNEAFGAFCYLYNASCISLSTIPSNRWTNGQMGNPLNPSYVPDMFNSFSDRMNFLQRVQNTITTTLEVLYHYFYQLPKQDKILRKYFPESPSIFDLYHNTSLILLNAHAAINYPVPLVPNMIPIGGYHISPPERLPKDIQKYMDDAEDGVIFFSLGSNLNGTDMGEHRINAILNVFRKLKQTVLWKMNSDTLSNLPSNVKLGAWFPQQSILAHPNTKLFISHCGLLSVIESIYHGVPMVTIPVYGDQPMNAVNAMNGGYARTVSYAELNEENLYNAVHEVLTNPRYRNTARMRSKMFHDNPMRPLDKAVFWVEYVIRHKGAPHLKTTALSLSWYQYLLLDVFLFIIIVILSIFVIITKIITELYPRKKDKLSSLGPNLAKM